MTALVDDRFRAFAAAAQGDRVRVMEIVRDMAPEDRQALRQACMKVLAAILAEYAIGGES